MAPHDLVMKTVVSEMFMQNAFVIHLPGNPECLIIDPGFEAQPIIDYIQDEKLTPAAILNTHGHADHIAGNAAMKQQWPDCPLMIGAEDAEKLTDPVLNLSQGYGVSIVSPPADRLLHEGDEFDLAGFQFDILETPGHCRGHIVFVWKAAAPPIVFNGDVLFRGSIGRTDFPDGDFEALRSSIHEKLFKLPDDTIVLTGHGDATTIGFEKQMNPYVGLGVQ